jgi:hypothetical protein
MAADNHTNADGSVNRVAVEPTGHSSNGATAGEVDDRMARAEQMVDQLAEKVAHCTAALGKKLLWFSARLREEAEDIWAEAQSIRRGEKP